MHSWCNSLSGECKSLEKQVPSEVNAMSQGLVVLCFVFLLIPFSCTAPNFKHTFPDMGGFLTISQTILQNKKKNKNKDIPP